MLPRCVLLPEMVALPARSRRRCRSPAPFRIRRDCMRRLLTAHTASIATFHASVLISAHVSSGSLLLRAATLSPP
jgi:hypothetical protein